MENLNNIEYSKELDLWASLYLFMNELRPGSFVITKEPVLNTVEDVHNANMAQIQLLLHMGVTVSQMTERIPELKEFLKTNTSMLS